MFGVEGMHVLHVTRDPDVGGEQGLVVLDVESDADLTGCPDCGVVAVGHGMLRNPSRPVQEWSWPNQGATPFCGHRGRAGAGGVPS